MMINEFRRINMERKMFNLSLRVYDEFMPTNIREQANRRLEFLKEKYYLLYKTNYIMKANIKERGRNGI